ncbi:MAG: branched-chain amino acid ABC transporter permease [Verrucomicrobia bacterium]|nr:branched-chain amino acid ABC transporter permease [Verrucomicrobiota bacterium]
MTEFLQQLINGISVGAIYALIAHSDVFMVGAYLGYYLGPRLGGGSIGGGLVVLAAAMAGCAILGMQIERFAYRPLRRPTRLSLAAVLGWCGGAAAGWFVVPLALRGLAGWSPGWATYAPLLKPLAAWAGAELGCRLAEAGFGRTPGLRASVLNSRGGAATLTVLITAIGVSLLLQNLGQKVFGANPKAFPQPFPVTQFHFSGLTVSSNQLVVLLVTLVLLGALHYVVHHTRTGTALRAVSFNATAASLVGIHNDRIIAFTFALGSALAGAGGILYAMNYPSIDPLMGTLPGLKAFVAAVLGGIGNLPGAALGGLLIGLVETLVSGTRLSTFRDAIAFAILIGILLFRPAGLLGRLRVEKV